MQVDQVPIFRYLRSRNVAGICQCPIFRGVGLISLEQIPDGAKAMMDGHKGEIVIHPRKEEYNRTVRGMKAWEHKEVAFAKKLAGRRLKMDGETIHVKANVSSSDEAKQAKKYGCDGVGLYRI